MRENEVRLPTNTTSQVTYSQLQSSFCTKLPTESQLMIYHHLVGGLREKGDLMHMVLHEDWRDFSRCGKPAEDGRPCNWKGQFCKNWTIYKYGVKGPRRRGG